MNQREHLLTKVGEEATEVAMAVAKAVIFGLEDHNVKDPAGPSCQDNLIAELLDLNATVGLCQRLGILPTAEWDQGARERAKRLKISQFMAYAHKVGRLDRAPTEDGKPPICPTCANGARLEATVTPLAAIVWCCPRCQHTEPVKEINNLVDW